MPLPVEVSALSGTAVARTVVPRPATWSTLLVLRSTLSAPLVLRPLGPTLSALLALWRRATLPTVLALRRRATLPTVLVLRTLGPTLSARLVLRRLGPTLSAGTALLRGPAVTRLTGGGRRRGWCGVCHAGTKTAGRYA
jgi:hypothetical protein